MSFIRCRRCDSKILKVHIPTTEEQTHTLPDVAGEDKSYETWYVVKDMFHFENIGFLKSSDATKGRRLLTCADCEYEAIGFAQTDNKSFLVAKDLVLVKD